MNLICFSFIDLISYNQFPNSFSIQIQFWNFQNIKSFYFPIRLDWIWKKETNIKKVNRSLCFPFDSIQSVSSLSSSMYLKCSCEWVCMYALFSQRSHTFFLSQIRLYIFDVFFFLHFFLCQCDAFVFFFLFLLI